MKLRSFKKQWAKTGSSVASKIEQRKKKTHYAEKEVQKKKRTLHTCEQCGKSFKFKSVLLKHLRIHSTERPFKCILCGAAFKQYGCLLSHNRLHAPPRFACQECGKPFFFKRKLSLHSLKHNPAIEKSQVCSECGKTFASEGRLKLHQKVHQKAPCHKKENVPLKCSICNQTFKYIKNLKVHERIHSTEKSFNCRQCWKVFSGERLLQKHLRQHAEGQKLLKGNVEDTFSCTECKRTFQREASLLIHQCSAQAEKQFKCMTCGQTFKSESNLQAHGQVHTGEKWYSCEECGEGFKKKNTLWKHEMLHTGHKTYECSCCWRLFDSDSALKIHMEICNHLRAEVLEEGEQLREATLTKTTNKSPVEEDKSFQCTTCGMHFSHDIKRMVHERFHSNEKDCSCIQCGKSFICQRDLWRHLNTHTRKKHHGNYQCNDCGKTFTSISSQTKHRRVHTGEMPYKCADCGKSYRWRGLLESHKRTHTGEKPYQCDQCEKKFAYHSSLCVHRKIHAELKAFKCLKCERKFSYSHQLIRHQVIHMEEKPFSCVECGKRYWFKGSLRNHRKTHSGEGGSRKTLHKKIHSGEKPFSCSICCKRFIHKNSLFNHMNIHSGEKPFSCSVCNKRFLHKSSLFYHNAIHSRKTSLSFSDDGKSFTPMTIRSPHQKVHSKEQSQKCRESEKDQDKAEHVTLDQTSTLENPLAVHQSEHTEMPPTATLLGASVTITATPVTILWFRKTDAATTKVTIPIAPQPWNCHQNRKGFDQTKHTRLEQATSLENSLVGHQNGQTTEMPAAATMAASTSDAVAHNMVVPRVTKFTDAISSAMKLVAVAKRTARKSYLSKLSLATSDSDKPFRTHSELEFPVIPKSEAVTTPTATIQDPAVVTYAPNASVTPHQKTTSQLCMVSTAEMSFWCADCGMGWKDKATFSEHRRFWHLNTRPRQCLHCAETFHSKFDFENHCRNHRPDGPVIDLPAATLPAVTTPAAILPVMTESVITASPADVLIAPKPEEEVPYAISDSTATHSAVLPAAVTCVSCGDSFHQISNLLDHLKTHVANGCNVTENIHQKKTSGPCEIESAERYFSCDYCVLDFKSEALFIEHQKFCPSTSMQRASECCGQSFHTKFDFDTHCNNHITERVCFDTASVIAPSVTVPAPTTSSVIMPSVTQFADSELNESKPASAQPASIISPSGTVVAASSPVNVIVLRVPTLSGAIPADSEVCYNSNASGILRQETFSQRCRTFFPERAYWCVDCSMGFKYEPMLRRHRTIWHTPKKPKPCPKCGKTFSTRYENEMHLNTRNGKIMCVGKPAGIASPDITPAAIKPILSTPSTTKIYHNGANEAKLGVHLCADSPATNVPASVGSGTTDYVTLPTTTISATTSSGTFTSAKKDGMTELNDTICQIAKHVDRNNEDMPVETNFVLSMPSVTQLNNTVPIMVKHADQLLEPLLTENILTETSLAEKQPANAVQIEEMYAGTQPAGRKPAETTASSARPDPGIAPTKQSSATNPDPFKLVGNTSVSSMLADTTFMVGRFGTEVPAVTTCTIPRVVNMSTTTKTHLTPSEVTVAAAKKPVSMDSASSIQIDERPAADKLIMTDSALTTCTATVTTVTMSTVTTPTSTKLTLAEIGENMVIQGKHDVVMPDVSKPILTTPNLMRPASIGLEDLIPNVASPTVMLCQDMPDMTMSEATRSSTAQYDDTLVIERKTAVCKPTLTTPSTVTSSVTFSASRHVALRPDELTSTVSTPDMELDDKTLNEGKTTAGKSAATTSTATIPVAAMPYAVTPVTIAQRRDGLDQKAVLVLRWRIHPAMGPQLHEGASAPAGDSI